MKAESFIKQKEIDWSKPFNKWNRTAFKKALCQFAEIQKQDVSRRFIATIQYLDDGSIFDNLVFKIGDPTEEDEDVFFYLSSESQLENLKNEGINGWIILEVEEIK